MTERDIFLAALKQPTAAERAVFLDQACGSDARRRGQIEALLAEHEQLGSYLESPVAAGQRTLDQPPVTECPGAVIGPYKLLQQLGEGGMGVVWMAEQTQPVQRKVALKVIKPGMDSRQVVARFEAERQALAMMDHVNIARVFDGGATENGRPYFVMELVHGVPITKYCDDNLLTPRERLELFVPVCQAIQHAHQKGIIHRDIKPSNVMVTLYDGKPVPKVIDFGVAKAIEQKLTERTLFTQYGTMVGTLEYMSPEQAEMSALGVDTRSDIYSLGVLLYELLTGNTPLTHMRMKEVAYAEILRMIKEVEPPKPSTRLSDSGEALASISANRHMEPAKLTKLVRGELDWIVMKTLEKDRNRRYETANGFAMDVQRYLADEPVQACPPSAWYRLRKFARRNKAALTMVSALAVAVVLVVGSFGWIVRDRAAREEDAAREREARQAKIVGQVEVFLAEVERLQKEQKWPEALAAARRAEAVVSGGEADAATTQRVRALLKDLGFIDRLEQIRMQLATIVEGKLDYAGADREYARAFRDYGVDALELPVETSIDRLKARPALAIPLAAALDDWVFVRVRRWVSGKDVAGWNRLVAVARGIDPEPLRNRLRATWGQPVSKVQDELRRMADSIDIRVQHPATLVSLARTLQQVKHSDSALRLLRDAQYVNPGDFWLNFELGYALYKQKDYEGAIRYYTAAVSIRPNSAAAHTSLGVGLAGQKKLDEAIACYRKAIDLEPKYALAHTNLGFALGGQNKLDEAIAWYRAAIDLDPKTAAAYHGLGMALQAQKKPDEAIAIYRKLIEVNPNDAEAHFTLGFALRDQKKWKEAIAAFRQAIAVDPKYVGAYTMLGHALRQQGKPDEEIAIYRKAIEGNPNYADAYVDLGVALEHEKKPDEAIAVYRQGLERLPDKAGLHAQLGHVLWKQRRLEEAAASFRQAIRLFPPVNQYYQYYYLGLILNQQKKPKEAVDALRKAIDLNPKFTLAHHQLGVTLAALGQDAEAIACYRKVIEVEPKDDVQASINVQAYMSLGNALHAQKKLDEAVSCFKKVLELDPKSVAAYIGLGNVLRSQDKLDEAIAEHRQAVTLLKKMAATSPRLTASQNSLAVLLNDRAWQLVTRDDPKSRDPKRALELAQEAGALAPNWPNWKTLGVAHYRAGNWKAAVEALEKSRQLNPHFRKDSVILFFLSMAHGRLNEKEQARTFYDQAAQWRMGIGSTEQELRRLCAEAAALLGVEAPPTLKEWPGPTLLRPAAGATLDNGTLEGSKLRVWEFDWSDVPGATQYHLHVIAAAAAVPVINNPMLTSSSYRFESKGQAGQGDRRWKVRALVKGTWTDWSEERTFAVAPLDDNKSASPKK